MFFLPERENVIVRLIIKITTRGHIPYLTENTLCFGKTSSLMFKTEIIVAYCNIHKNTKIYCSGKMLIFRLVPKANSDYSCVVSVSLCAWNHSAPTGRIFLSSSSSSSSSICHGVGPLVDPFRSHVSRSLFKGLP